MSDMGETIEVDSKSLLAEVLKHMQQQNEHQVSQLSRGEAIIRQLQSTNRRVNVLVGAAVLLLGLGAVHQQKIERIVMEQQAAQQRSVTLERTVDQKISTGTADVVKKVEELGTASPRVVTAADGTLSLSVPVAIDTSTPPVPSAPPEKAAIRVGGARPSAPRPSSVAAAKRYSVVKTDTLGDRVLLPLE